MENKIPYSSIEIDSKLIQKRREYRESGIPVLLDESLRFLLFEVKRRNPKRILEIGSATGCTGIAMLSVCDASLTAIEIDEESYLEAKDNYAEYGIGGRVTQYLADAAEVLPNFEKKYDFIFMDGAKSSYDLYLPYINKLLTDGGELVADNVLYRGLIEEKRVVPHGQKTIVTHMRSFIEKIISDENYNSCVLHIGDGLLVAERRFAADCRGENDNEK